MMNALRFALAALTLGSVALAAQDPHGSRDYSTRSELEALALRLDSTGHKDSKAAASAGFVRQRLTEGDFHVGDRILLHVEGEQQLSDTFTVQEGQLLRLPIVGTVPLYGVLRSELEDLLLPQIARYIRDPQVHARELVRIGILGEVIHPGFYLMAPSSEIEDLIMAAGGPTQKSNLGGMTARRSDGEFLSQDVIGRAVAQRQTLDQLGMRSGDAFAVPSHGNFGYTIAVFATLVSIPLMIITITHYAH